MALATLSIDIVAKLASFEQNMSRAVRIAEKQAAGLERAFLKAGAALSTLGVGISVSGLTLIAKAAIDGMDRLNDLKDATGASIENLSALEDVALRTGSTVDDMAGALTKLNRTLKDAEPESAPARALEAIGLKVADLKKLDPAVAFREIAKALAGYADDGNKARIITELFGRGVERIAPLLAELGRTTEWNATVTTAAAEEAEKFNKELFSLQKNATDAARSIAGPLVTALNSFFEAARDKDGFWSGLKKQADIGGLRGALGGYERDLANLRPKVAEARKLLEETGGTQESRVLNFYSRADAARTIANFEAIEAAARDTQRQLFDILGVEGGRGNIVPPTVKPSAGDVRDKADKPPKPKVIAPDIDEAMVRAVRAIEQTDAGKIADLNEQLTALFTLQRETRGQVPAVAEAIKVTREELAKLDPALVKAAEQKKHLDKLLADTPTGVMKEVLADVELLNKAFKEGAIPTVEQWAEAVRNATGKLSSGLKDTADEMTVFAEQAQRNIQDALGDTLEQMLGGNFNNIGRMWAQLLQRMAAQALAMRLNQYLFGESKDLSGGAFGEFLSWAKGALGSVFGGSSGAPDDSVFNFDWGGTRATGGAIAAGRAYLVGERGPELVVPKSAGQVIPNEALGGSIFTYAPTINVSGGVDVAVVEAMMARERVRIQRMLAYG